jgi:hypothetical protein
MQRRPRRIHGGDGPGRNFTPTSRGEMVAAVGADVGRDRPTDPRGDP